jgi:Family of unknown function (DUF5317)/Major Facilitator Superfamily
VFLLPSLVVGLLLALALGGRPSRLLAVRFRLPAAVVAALAIQVVVFSPLAERAPERLADALHLASYALLVVFAVANLHVRPLVPVMLGMLANAVAIAANGGKMPVSESAARAAGVDLGPGSNVSASADRLAFLGDVFALPAQLPLANVFSVGDLLIGFGMVALVVVVSLDEGGGAGLEPRRLVAPLRLPAYRRLAAGKLVSHVGDWLTVAALVGWVYAETGSTGQVAGLLLVRLGPPIVGGGVAAFVVDRLPKIRVLVGVEILRGVAVAVALAAVVADTRPLAFVALGVSGALAAVAAATVPALVPSLVGERDFAAANAGLGIAQDGAMALGALGAGIALSAAGPEIALAVPVLTFALAAVLYSGIRVVAVRPAEAGEEAGTLRTLRYLLRRRILLALVAAFTIATVATALTNVTLPRFLDDELGLGAGAYGFGLAALAAGLALGQAAVGGVRVGGGGTRWIGLAFLVMAVLFLGLALTAHGPTALLLLGLVGFVDGTTDVLFDTTVQRESEHSQYGAVFGLSSAFMAAAMMGAVALAPLANALAPVAAVLVVAAACLALAGGVTLAGAGRRREPAASARRAAASG